MTAEIVNANGNVFLAYASYVKVTKSSGDSDDYIVVFDTTGTTKQLGSLYFDISGEVIVDLSGYLKTKTLGESVRLSIQCYSGVVCTLQITIAGWEDARCLLSQPRTQYLRKINWSLVSSDEVIPTAYIPPTWIFGMPLERVTGFYLGGGDLDATRHTIVYNRGMSHFSTTVRYVAWAENDDGACYVWKGQIPGWSHGVGDFRYVSLECHGTDGQGDYSPYFGTHDGEEEWFDLDRYYAPISALGEFYICTIYDNHYDDIDITFDLNVGGISLPVASLTDATLDLYGGVPSFYLDDEQFLFELLYHVRPVVFPYVDSVPLAYVVWQNRFGRENIIVFEVHDTERVVDDTLSIQSQPVKDYNLSKYYHHKGVLFRSDLTAYDVWFFSDIITSRRVQVAFVDKILDSSATKADLNLIDVNITTDKLKIPTSDAKSPYSLSIDFEYQEIKQY